MAPKVNQKKQVENKKQQNNKVNKKEENSKKLLGSSNKNTKKTVENNKKTENKTIGKTKTDNLVKDKPVVEENVDEGRKHDRYFKCNYMGLDEEVKPMGRYKGKKPKQAAIKALSAIARKYKDNKVNMPSPLKFVITECTSGSAKKKYAYKGEKIQLDEPVVVEVTKVDANNQVSKHILMHSTKNVVSPIKLEECLDLIHQSYFDKITAKKEKAKQKKIRQQKKERRELRKTKKVTKKEESTENVKKTMKSGKKVRKDNNNKKNKVKVITEKF